MSTRRCCRAPIAPCDLVLLSLAIAIEAALYDHLRNTLSTQRLAALESLALEAGQRIENRRNQQEDGANNQARCLGPDADPLHGAHDKVYGGAHVVGAELADEGIELGGGRTDAEEERYFDENDDK